MNWIFESRSKDFQYDQDLEEGSYVPFIKWYEVLLFPIIALPLAIIFAISEILFVLAIFAYSFYEIAQKLAESGKLEFPALPLIGAGLAILLPTLISKHVFDDLAHPTITLCALIFLIFFSLAQLTGLVWRLLKRFTTLWKQK